MSTVCFCHTCQKIVEANDSTGELLCTVCGGEFVELHAEKVIPLTPVPAPLTSTQKPLTLPPPTIPASLLQQMPAKSAYVGPAQAPVLRPRPNSKYDCPCDSPVCPLVGYIFSECTAQHRIMGIEFFRKVAQNILMNPDDPKYRRVKHTPAVKEKLAAVSGLAALFEGVGFQLTRSDDQQTEYYTLPPDSENVLLKDALQRIAKYENQEKEAMDRNAEIMAQNLAEINLANAGKAQRRELMAKEADARRKMNAMRPVADSVATRTQFGAVHKEIPKPPPAPVRR